MRLDDLRALRARLDAATGPDQELDLDLWNAVTGERWEWVNFHPTLGMGRHDVIRLEHAEYTRLIADGFEEQARWLSEPGQPFAPLLAKPERLTESLDAAVALVERIAPDLDVHLFSECGGYFAFVEEFKDSRHVRYDGFAGEGVCRELWPSAVLSAAFAALISRSEAEAGRG